MLILILASWLTLVELNCENLFDCQHDTLKQDTEWCPASLDTVALLAQAEQYSPGAAVVYGRRSA